MFPIFILLTKHKKGICGLEYFQQLNEKQYQGFESFHVKGELGKTFENYYMETTLSFMVLSQKNKRDKDFRF